MTWQSAMTVNAAVATLATKSGALFSNATNPAADGVARPGASDNRRSRWPACAPALPDVKTGYRLADFQPLRLKVLRDELAHKGVFTLQVFL
jgi:hypothetical protein